MLHAVLEKMQQRYPEAQFAVAPRYRECESRYQYLQRCKLGLFQKSWLWAYGIQFGNLAQLLPSRIRNMYGLVLDREVDVVLDASGFSYSEQWGIKSCRELSTSVRRWRRRGTKVILLPQAFGPFRSKRVIHSIKLIVDNVDLIFAREPISYQHLIDITGARDNIKIAPDFTNLVNGIIPDHFNQTANRFCIIPNYRMIDKTSHEISSNYVSFLARCIAYLVKKIILPFILIHEGKNDRYIADMIIDQTSMAIPVIQESDAIHIKGILGNCEGVLSSRYHGLVSALSQGVHSLATSWSHKYQLLFDEYNFPDGVLNIKDNFNATQKKIDLITEDDTKNIIRNKLLMASGKLKQQSEAMWNDVFSMIEH